MSVSRFEPGFTRHLKRTKSGPVASWLWTCSVDHCTSFRTDGFLDAEAVADLCPAIKGAALKACVEKLIAVGSWELVERGYLVHGYLDHNLTASQVEADRKANRDRYLRWKNKRQEPGPSEPTSTPLPTATQTPSPTDSQRRRQRVSNDSLSQAVRQLGSTEPDLLVSTREVDTTDRTVDRVDNPPGARPAPGSIRSAVALDSDTPEAKATGEDGTGAPKPRGLTAEEDRARLEALTAQVAREKAR